ncbi:hypothetical protein AB4455_18295 [Vibrio sp. 10N.261.46.E12]|uniref:hypothetical protein n=1 Tax=Vibrio sp. 10N.261.46.E12 TaxID=3229663 RepID=UPI00354C3434
MKEKRKAPRLSQVDSARRDHQAAKLLSEGKSPQDIALELNISKGSIYAVLKRAKKI